MFNVYDISVKTQFKENAVDMQLVCRQNSRQHDVNLQPHVHHHDIHNNESQQWSF